MEKRQKRERSGFTYDVITRTAHIDLYERGRAGRRLRRTLRDVSRREAETEYVRLRDSVRRGEIRLGRKPTFEEYVKSFPRLRVRKASTERTTKYIVDDLIDTFGSLRLNQIATDLVMKYANDRLADGLKSGTVRRRLTELRSLLREAIERDLLAKLPFNSRHVFKKISDSKPVVRYLTPSERRALIDAFDDEKGFRTLVETDRHVGPVREWHGTLRRFGGGRRGDSKATKSSFSRFRRAKGLVICLVDTGLRRDDARLMQWDRLNMAARTIFLYQAKTGEDVFIPMTDDLYLALAELEQERDPKDPHVFVTEQGRPLSVSTLNRTWAVAKRLAAIKRPFRIHDLRHTTGSALVQAGVPLYEVGQLLGHRDPRSTRRYAHLAPDNLRSAIRALERWQGAAANAASETAPGAAVVNPVVNRPLSAVARLRNALRSGRSDDTQLAENKKGRWRDPSEIRLERATGLEPATSTLARSHSTN
jgi:integrase